MMQRPARRRLGLAAAGLLLVTGSLAYADDDFEFADALSRRGYTDLATERFNALINDPKSTGAKRAEGQYGLALLKYGEARILAGERNDKRRPEMKAVLARFDEADQAFAKFIGENPSHARNLEAKLSRGKLLQDKAEYVNVCIENSWLPSGESPTTWQKQVADWFDLAIQLFQAAEDRAKSDRLALKEARKENTPEWDEVYDRLGLVWLYRIAALYGKGAALPKGDPAGTAALNEAIKQGTDDYQWEYGDSVRGLWAIHFAGLASAALDKPADAYNNLKTAASFTAEKDSSPPIQDVTFQSYRELGKACLKFGRREKDDWVARALDLFNGNEKLAGLAKSWPEWKKHTEGQRAGLVWAQLLDRQGKPDKALALVQEIVKAAEAANSPARYEATRLLGVLLQRTGAGAGDASLDPKMLRKIAIGKWREQDYRGAIAAFQAVISTATTPEDRDEFVWEAWDYIGRCYGVNGRYYEAFLAFDQIEQAWKADRNNATLSELTNDTAWSRAAALDGLSRQTKDAEDVAARKQALEDFAKDHPDSPRNQGAEQMNAENKLKDAEVLRGDAAAYRAALTEVLKLFEALPPTSKSADQNKAKIAQIHQRIAISDPSATDLAEIAKAVELADAWLAQKRPESTDSSVRRAQEQGRRIALAVALQSRAEMAATLAQKASGAGAKQEDRDLSAKAHQDLLDAIDRLGAAFKEVAANGQAQLDNWRAEGLIGTEKVNDADQLVGKLLETTPDARNNFYLAALIGNALERRAHVQKGKDDLNGYKELMIRSARRREWVLDNTKTKEGEVPRRNPDIVRTIASCYAEGAEFAKAEALYGESQRTFESDALTAPTPKEKEAALASARVCRIKLIGLLVKQGKYDAAIPQLEKEIAKDPKARDAFLGTIQKTDSISDQRFKELIAGTDANRTLLEQLSEAYMKAPSKERLFAAVNLCALLNMTMDKAEKHGPDYIEYAYRRAEAYLMLGEYTKLPEHFRAALAAVRNGIVIPGYVDAYEQTVPGSKRRGEMIMQKAEDGLRKLGAK